MKKKKDFMKILFLALIFISTNALAVCSSPITRTNFVTRELLTSARLNTELNSVYARANLLPGDCIVDASIGTVQITDGSITKQDLTTGATANLEMTAKVAAYTVAVNDQVLIGDTTSSTVTFSLPTASGIHGRVLEFILSNSAAIQQSSSFTLNPLVLDGFAAETIGGKATVYTNVRGGSIKIISDGTNWQLITSPKVENEIFLNAGDGHGSVQTKIRKLIFYQRLKTGSAFSQSMTSTNGLEITILEDGAYSIVYCDAATTAGKYFGISLNASIGSLSTNISAIPHDEILGMIRTQTVSSGVCLPVTTNLKIGDVIRPHTNGDINGTVDFETSFRITKVGN